MCYLFPPSIVRMLLVLSSSSMMLVWLLALHFIVFLSSFCASGSFSRWCEQLSLRHCFMAHSHSLSRWQTRSHSRSHPQILELCHGNRSPCSFCHSLFGWRSVSSSFGIVVFCFFLFHNFLLPCTHSLCLCFDFVSGISHRCCFARCLLLPHFSA